MSLTNDPQDPRLDKVLPGGQQEAYLVLSDEERAKGFVRPVRTAYKHRDCGAVTSMHQDIAETYARDPKYYGGTFCSHCRGHFNLQDERGPVFFWEPDGSAVGS